MSDGPVVLGNVSDVAKSELTKGCQRSNVWFCHSRVNLLQVQRCKAVCGDCLSELSAKASPPHLGGEAIHQLMPFDDLRRLDLCMTHKAAVLAHGPDVEILTFIGMREDPGKRGAILGFGPGTVTHPPRNLGIHEERYEIVLISRYVGFKQQPITAQRGSHDERRYPSSVARSKGLTTAASATAHDPATTPRGASLDRALTASNRDIQNLRQAAVTNTRPPLTATPG